MYRAKDRQPQAYFIEIMIMSEYFSHKHEKLCHQVIASPKP